MRALFLNWRDTKHPAAGGAEYVTLELAKGMIRAGWQVDWFTTRPRGLAAREEVEGVQVLRAGGRFTVQRAARRYYRSLQHGYYDFILDQVHGWPFFAPRWADCPVMLYLNEVTGEIASFMLPWPLGPLYQWLEPRLLAAYRHTPALTISRSTKNELRALGHRAVITVLTLGCDAPRLPRLPSLSIKEHDLTVIFAARLVPLKRPAEAIQMLAELQRRISHAQLWIIGSGEAAYTRALHRLAVQLGVADRIHFFGFVPTAKKHDLMQRAHFVTITSIKEGWGLTIPEANALGTIGVTYNVAGVRDSNLHNQTGILTHRNTPSALAKAIIRLYRDKRRYQKLRRAAFSRAQKMTWTAANETFLAAVKKTVAKKKL